MSAPSPPAIGLLAAADQYGTLLLVLALLFDLVCLVFLWLVSRVTPKGTILAIAAGIYLVSFVLPDFRMRELVMLRGALRMLGFAGGILGLVDLLRKREPKEAASGPSKIPKRPVRRPPVDD